MMREFYITVSDECDCCGLCVALCPLHCLTVNTAENRVELQYKECWYCGTCEIECPRNCLKVHFPFLVI